MKGAWLEIRLPEGDLTFPEMMSQQSLVVLCFTTSSNTNSFLSVAIVDWPKTKKKKKTPKSSARKGKFHRFRNQNLLHERSWAGIATKAISSLTPAHEGRKEGNRREPFLDTVTALHGRQLRHCSATLEDLEFIYRRADGSPELPNCPLLSWEYRESVGLRPSPPRCRVGAISPEGSVCQFWTWTTFCYCQGNCTRNFHRNW